MHCGREVASPVRPVSRGRATLPHERSHSRSRDPSKNTGWGKLFSFRLAICMGYIRVRLYMPTPHFYAVVKEVRCARITYCSAETEATSRPVYFILHQLAGRSGGNILRQKTDRDRGHFVCIPHICFAPRVWPVDIERPPLCV